MLIVGVLNVTHEHGLHGTKKELLLIGQNFPANFRDTVQRRDIARIPVPLKNRLCVLSHFVDSLSPCYRVGLADLSNKQQESGENT